MKDEKVAKAMRLRESVIDKVKKQADKEHRSFTNMVEVLIERALKDA